MTDELKRFLISQLRRATYKWPPYSQAWKAAWKTRGFYECAACKDLFGRKEMQLDHLDPCMPIAGWDGLEGYVSRLFCDSSGYQALCKPCHKTKTLEENSRRKK